MSSSTANRAPLKRRRLGRRLWRLRMQSGLTQEEVGREMHYSDSKISRFESGQLPDYHALTAMLDLYGLTVSQWQPIIAEWKLAKEPGWWAVYKLDDVGYVSMEDEAIEVRESQPSYIPGLLQTEAYARATFAISSTLHSKQWIDKQIEVRLRRQERLAGDDPLVYEAIIQESALCRHNIEPAIHRAQLLRIVEQANRPNVTVRVIPERVGAHDGLVSALILLRFPDSEDLDVAYTEHALGANHTDDPVQVAAARLRLNHLARLALDPADSIMYYIPRLSGSGSPRRR
jgi:transcriptional regulator with XRE-family HTH domain